MSYWDSFKTGDLCISKTSGKYASFIRGVTNSNYNHSCVAIRIDTTKLPEIKILRTGGALLFIEGQNLIHDNRRLTVNFMQNEKVLKLSLDDKYYTSEFEEKVLELLYTDIKEIILELDKPKKVKIPNGFNSESHRFDKKQSIRKLRVLCSEYSANFYNITLNSHLDKNPVLPQLFTPENFLNQSKNPYYKLFNSQTLVYDANVSNYDGLKLIFYIILIIILIYLIYKVISMSLNK
jgi:hypothetical protein